MSVSVGKICLKNMLFKKIYWVNVLELIFRLIEYVNLKFYVE